MFTLGSQEDAAGSLSKSTVLYPNSLLFIFRHLLQKKKITSYECIAIQNYKFSPLCNPGCGV